jgi:ADP-dependent phosphofructokinase/glucokinase
MLQTKPLQELKSILARYLENDDKLVSLNFLSGVVRLVCNDYDNPDGERRLKMAFEDISKFSSNDSQNIILGLFNIVQDKKYRDIVVKTILEANECFAEQIYKVYQNDMLDSHIICAFAQKLLNVGGKINDKYRKD